MTNQNNYWEKVEKELIEKCAALEHARWARWQAYLHDKTLARDGMICFSQDDFLRWARQIKTPYSELSEQEKESDRREVREYLPLFHTAFNEYRREVRKAIKDKTSVSNTPDSWTQDLCNAWKACATQHNKDINDLLNNPLLKEE